MNVEYNKRNWQIDRKYDTKVSNAHVNKYKYE